MTRATATLIAMTLGLAVGPAWAASSATTDTVSSPTLDAATTATATPAPFIAGPTQGREAHRALFAAIRARNWTEAKARANALSSADPVRALALSEIYTAKDSPRAEMFDLLDLMAKAEWLPSAEQLGRMAQKRGAVTLPALPATQKLVWLGGASRREYLTPTRADSAAQALVARLQSYIKNDDPAGAEALLASGEPGLTPDGIAEARQRVAWSYYITNDDANARRMAQSALQSGSGGDWTTQAYWTIGLSAWRQNDPRTAAPAFHQVATRADNDDMAAAGAYWASRAYMNAGDPRRVEPLLRLAAARTDSFYGMLARETLGIAPNLARRGAAGYGGIAHLPTVRAALAMHDIGEDALAGELIRRQAELTGTAHYDQLIALAASLNLAETQLWLAHNGPAGKKPDLYARFPMPKWRPDGGWRVDPALIFAHALQESGFRPHVVSPAGARGVMQVMPGTAGDMAGGRVSAQDLNVPSTNMEYGQRYLEQLRDNSATGGLLPKVMAAYNAGPTPVARWNTQVRDGGDPLLFIESLPFYETRAYVNIVMRNYWVYQLQNRGTSDALVTMAQGRWPKFPGARAGVLAGGGPSGPAATLADASRPQSYTAPDAD